MKRYLNQGVEYETVKTDENSFIEKIIAEENLKVNSDLKEGGEFMSLILFLASMNFCFCFLSPRNFVTNLTRT